MFLVNAVRTIVGVSFSDELLFVIVAVAGKDGFRRLSPPPRRPRGGGLRMGVSDFFWMSLVGDMMTIFTVDTKRCLLWGRRESARALASCLRVWV